MAKQAAKKPAAKKAEAPKVQEEIVETVVETQVETVEENKWEIKDRMYYLSGNRQPLTYRLQTKPGIQKPLMWFEEENS